MAKPSTTKPIVAAASVAAIMPRSAPVRSAIRAAAGIANRRTTSGAASTMPICCASSPLTFSQSGKNGYWMPTSMNRPA
jgi:hypothetical protein